MNNFFSFFTLFGFYITLFGIISGIILTWLKEHNNVSNKLKKWIYIPFICALIATPVTKWVNDQISEFNRQKIISLQSELDSTKTNVESQSKNVNKLNEKMELNKKIANVVDSALNLKYETTKTKLDSAKEEIEKIQAPRVISPKQINEFVNFLQFKPKGKIIIGSVDEFEPMNFANQIRNMLIKAGYSCEGVNPMIGMSGKGVILMVKNKYSSFNGSGWVQKAFFLIGIEVGAQTFNGVEKNALMIFVGEK